MPGPFNYDELFSDVSADVPLRVVSHAEYDFAVAYPAPETLPIDGLTTSLQVMLDARADEMARELAYYPHSQGSPELREFTSQKLMQDRGIAVSPDDIVITSGSSEANGMIIQALTDPGDTVLTERYVYTGTLGQLERFGADVVGVPIDDDGIIPEALDELIADLTAEGRRPKYLYTIPEHQNPTGSTLPESRRREILEIAHRRGMPILEDDCYVDLRFEGETQPAFRTMDDSGIVIHVASYSKLVAPGLRLGYFTAQGDVMRRAAELPGWRRPQPVRIIRSGRFSAGQPRPAPRQVQPRPQGKTGCHDRFPRSQLRRDRRNMVKPAGRLLRVAHHAGRHGPGGGATGMHGGWGRFCSGPRVRTKQRRCTLRAPVLRIRDPRKEPQRHRPPGRAIQRTRRNVSPLRQLTRPPTHPTARPLNISLPHRRGGCHTRLGARPREIKLLHIIPHPVETLAELPLPLEMGRRLPHNLKPAAVSSC